MLKKIALWISIVLIILLQIVNLVFTNVSYNAVIQNVKDISVSISKQSDYIQKKFVNLEDNDLVYYKQSIEEINKRLSNIENYFNIN